MESETVYEVVKKIVGPIEPVGCSNTDEKRLENLKLLTSVVGRLLNDIDSVAMCKNNYQHSMQVCGQWASDFQDEIGIPE